MQRCHWKANEVDPGHVPSLAASSCPTRASPVIVGLQFRERCRVPPDDVVGSERAFVEPSGFTAVTRTRIVRPTSTCPTLYVLPSEARSTSRCRRLQRNQR